MPRAKRTNPSATKTTQNYRRPESDSFMRPDTGTQAQFREKKPPSNTRHELLVVKSLKGAE